MTAPSEIGSWEGDDVAYWIEGGGCDCCTAAVLTGAAVAFGLMGMAEAIRAYGPQLPATVCHRCKHPGAHAAGHENYDNDLYACQDGNTYCGYCADDLGF